MVVIAGPPGGGKSTGFPASETGLESFNADDRAAALNGGSYLNLTEELRTRANRELEHFVSEHIQSATSFAFETTLRTDITVQQARLARRRGFSTLMMYVGVDDAEECIRRVQIRAQAGGHSAPPDVLRDIYRASLQNLAAAIRVFDAALLFDNSWFDETPELVLVTIKERIVSRHIDPPEWMRMALGRRLLFSRIVEKAFFRHVGCITYRDSQAAIRGRSSETRRSSGG
jgi:predicted ABC-type ATPase